MKREKPHFYDASEFENKNRKVMLYCLNLRCCFAQFTMECLIFQRKIIDKNNVKSTTKTNKAAAAQIKKKERKRLKELKLRETLAEAEDETLYESIMTPRKAEQLSIILDELNSKISICAWKP